MKKHSRQINLFVASVIFIGLIFSTVFLILPSNLSLPTFSTNQCIAKEANRINHNTTEKQEEVPHFNLFSIINRFLPH